MEKNITNNWIVSPNDHRKINITKEYPNNIKVKTIVEQFEETVNFYGNKTAFKYEINEQWENITWNQYLEMVKGISNPNNPYLTKI